jgi:hypothetical protein
MPGPNAYCVIGIAAFHGVGVVPIFKKAMGWTPPHSIGIDVPN